MEESENHPGGSDQPAFVDVSASELPRHRGGSRGGVHAGGLVLRVLAAAMSLFLIVYIGYLWQTVRGLNNNVQRIHLVEGGQKVNPITGKITTRYDIDGKAENILIAGNDDRSALTVKQARELRVGLDGGSLNTDTMMIVHVPADGSSATLISLPRDSYVDIPGYGWAKLNAAYVDGYDNAKGDANAKRAAGANLLIQVIEDLTGLNIDHFVEVSLLGFVTISDAVGGVPVNMCHSVNDTVAHDKALGLSGGSGLVISKGHHSIQGIQALEFVRQREQLPGGDIERTANQRYFLAAAFREIASAGILLNIGRLQNLVSAVDKSIYVDQGLNMLDLAKQMSSLSANNIRGQVIPTARNAQVPINGVPQDVGIINPAQIKTFINKIITGGGLSAVYKKAPLVDPSTVTVTIRNFGTQQRAAASAATTLDQAKFKTSVDQTSGRISTTTITYPKGMESQAKTLSRYVPGASVQQSDVSGVILTLGGDAIHVTSKPSHGQSPNSARNKSKSALDSTCVN